MEKRCNKCDRTLPLEHFYKDRHSKDGHTYTCRECKIKSVNDYKSRHAEKVKAYQLRYREKNRDRQETERKNKYNSLKTACRKCGETRQYVIQFHHIDPTTKLFNITEGGSRNRNIEDEVKKCVCLCSNCHDEFHYFYGKVPKFPKESLEEYLGVKL